MDVMIGRRRWYALHGLLFCFLFIAAPLHGQEQAIPLTDPPPLPTDAETISEEPLPEEEELAPYIVFVADDDLYARCGPGKDHYRTDPLRRGQELEVYVETGDGWLGIRPPDDSFCWIPGSAVELADEYSGSVIEDETIAWIGTHLGKARRSRWQVQLSVGEPVSVIGKTERATESGTETWLRIVPPSGEFRWVHRDQIVETAEDLVRLAAAAKAETPEMSEIESADDLVEAKPDDEVVQATNLSEQNPSPTPARSKPDATGSTRRGVAAEGLKPAEGVPNLVPLSDPSGRDALADTRKPADRPFEILRGADPEAFRDSGAVIGSGLRSGWAEEPQEKSVLQSEDASSLQKLSRGGAAAAAAISEPIRKVTDAVANFISPPRLVEIDPLRSAEDRVRLDDVAVDRWRVGSRRSPVQLGQPPRSLSTVAPIDSPVAQASATMPAAPAGRVIYAEQIARVADAVAQADAEAVSRVLSRLMVEGASADEVDPLLRRVETLLSSGDVQQANRTREIMQQAQRYRNLASRRDGATTIRSGAMPDVALATLPTTNAPVPRPPAASVSTVSSLVPLPTPETKEHTAVGYLVQVYSSRPNSPPFALTDDAGLTVAYLTPYPGINLRMHLNSRVAVRGNEKLLQGMNTRHILVDDIQRR